MSFKDSFITAVTFKPLQLLVMTLVLTILILSVIFYNYFTPVCGYVYNKECIEAYQSTEYIPVTSVYSTDGVPKKYYKPTVVTKPASYFIDVYLSDGSGEVRRVDVDRKLYDFIDKGNYVKLYYCNFAIEVSQRPEMEE